MTSISKPTPSKSPLPTSDANPLLRQHLRQAMQQCRDLTLALFETVDDATFCRQAHPDFSPIGWHLGHIAYTEALWLLEHSAGIPCQFPQYRQLFAADGLPKSDRVVLPKLAEVQQYLEQVRSQVFDYLEIAPLEIQERLWRWLLQHESQHCETISFVLALQQSQSSNGSHGLPSRFAALPSEMVCIPAGSCEYGHGAIEALDNERPVQRVDVATFWIDRYPVTCAQYRIFMAAGGYENARWWSREGWRWLQTAQVTEPLYWSGDATADLHPVSGVSWYEAEAYARFVGKRLPTEVEWEKAASWNPLTQQRQPYPWGEAEPDADRCNHSHWVGRTTPVDRYAAGQSPYGCYDMLGNVWEWTETWFDGYAGFEAYPYRGYSQVYFDGQHRVMRGGSWATRAWALRPAFRNWYHPHVRELFVGFRCAADVNVASSH